MKIGFWGLLTLLFIGLKLTDYIAWSWLWVLAPIWIQALLFIIVWAVIFTFDIHPKNGKAK